MCIGGSYGTVCRDSWDNQDASVVCRRLGFSPYGERMHTFALMKCTTFYQHAMPTGAVAITSGLFSDTSQSPTVSGVQCTGSEEDLLSCSRSTSIDTSRCGLSDDAGVVCQGG